MRSIFFLVLAANIFFFVRQYFFVNGVTKSDEQYIAQSSENAGSSGALLLLSERSGEKVGTEKDFAQVSSLSNQAGGVQKEGAPLCTMIGPYEQLLQAEYAVERLAALGADVHVVPVEIKEGESFWVYLVPEVSEREALNRLHELQRKNIESHIISKGDLTNGISFGRFSQYEDAEVLSLKIKNNGYDAQIKIMPKTIQETWVVVGEGFAEKIDDSVWEELIRKQKGLEKRQNYCLGVASH
jgi:hypothetical protein